MRGKIFSGERKASEFLQIEEYSEFIREKACFRPFPGTLNLRGRPVEIQRLKSNAEKDKMEGFEKNGKKFGGMKLYHVKVEGIKCCIVDPDLTRYGEDVVEICSEFRLRSKLGLEDGDRIKIKPGT